MTEQIAAGSMKWKNLSLVFGTHEILSYYSTASSLENKNKQQTKRGLSGR